MQIVILAGGLGTRLMPLTKDRPKALVEVAGRPFADRQLALLGEMGASRIVYCISHFADQLRDYVGDGRRFGLSVDYVEDGETPLGTGGAIRSALDAGLLEERFLVTYGDSFLPVPLAPLMETLETSGLEACMSVFRNDGRWDSSNVALDERGRIRLYDKQNRHKHIVLDHIDYGLLAFKRSFIERGIATGQVVDLADPLYRASLAGELAANIVTTRFWEMGSHDGLAELEAAIESGEVTSP